MSLSQKHSGLVLVPWFNREEWRYVFDLVNSPEVSRNRKALEIVQIWKSRTPILSTGIEGTLILLEVLTGSELLGTEQLRYVYATCLMRFLNLSAANSEKQGEFTKESTKNDLPDWLINLRHDVAHGHHMPALAMLKQGLEYSLNWIREKYWQPQSEIITDYCATKESHINEVLRNALLTYIYVKINLFQGNNSDEIWFQTAKDMIFKKIKCRISDAKMMTEILEEMIRQSLAAKQNKSGDDKVLLNLLVTQDCLLHCVGMDNSDINGFSKINEDFLYLWQNLLNILNEEKLLLKLANKLYQVLIDIELPVNLKALSALWIQEIFKALLESKSLKSKEVELKSEKDEEIVNNKMIRFEREISYEEESSQFEKTVLSKPGSYSKLFVTELLRYNKYPENGINDVLYIIDSTTICKEDTQNVRNNLFTFRDINEQTPEDDSSLDPDINSNVEYRTTEPNQTFIAEPRWTEIRDTSRFQNCPLGKLPHQINMKHPLLELQS